MATRKQVSCINKRGDHYNPHERIINIGGVLAGIRWKYSQADSISYIEKGVYNFYVSVGGYTTDVIVATHMGNKYIKTQPDITGKDNLLALPDCP